MTKNHIHIVGICGVGTGALAVAFHKDGWKVTGSDKGFYPPVSTNLTEAGIPYYAGWHPEKFDAAPADGGIGRPDCIIVGGSGTSLSNPEAIYAKEHNIPVLSFAQALGRYLIRPNSIVTTGTWGKTTSSAFLSYILIRAGMDPSYFSGGLSLSHPTGALVDPATSDWSVVEGDEYQAAIWDRQAKFNYYAPTHLLLTSVSWDHADLYPTEAEYFAAFEKLVTSIPAKTSASVSTDGLIVACIDDEGVNQVLAKCAGDIKARVVTYGTSEKATYRYGYVQHRKAGLSLDVCYTEADGKKETFCLASPMLGRYNAENITGSFALAHQIGIPDETIEAAIADFKGIRRRLERRFEGSVGGADITVLDCHAPTPEKAASGLESIREVYHGKIITIYEPNIGGRQKSSIAAYDSDGGAFSKADLVIIPRLTKLKIDETKTDPKDQPLEGQELADYISKIHKNVVYIENDEEVVARAIAEMKPSAPQPAASTGNVVAFLGSHGFRGMIEEVVKKLGN
jgi:UDP-N-acetylmuramate: L-alanyl-gamma-D-glutamyl-meso-diaminopimelate ligase